MAALSPQYFLSAIYTFAFSVDNALRNAELAATPPATVKNFTL